MRQSDKDYVTLGMIIIADFINTDGNLRSLVIFKILQHGGHVLNLSYLKVIRLTDKW